MADPRIKPLVASINRLKNSGPTSSAPYKCIVDSTPFDDDDDIQPLSKGNWIIDCRVLPTSPIYRNGAIKVQITIGPTYPFQPPKVCLKTSVFHPNITKEGEVCIDLLNKDGKWLASTNLDQVVKEVIEVIDKPSTNNIQYTEAADLYINNNREYERIATETFNKNAAPRN